MDFYDRRGRLVSQPNRIAEIHLTYRCDIGCGGCNRACFAQPPRIPDMTVETVNDWMEQVEANGFRKQCRIIGGEPTMHGQCLEIVRWIKRKGYKLDFWSNGYSERAKEIIAAVCQEKLGIIAWQTRKPDGPPATFDTKTIFCSPKDCGLKREPCIWGHRCGYSVDESGFTPCPIGGPIAAWLGKPAATRALKEFLDPAWIEHSFGLLCEDCGAYMDELVNSPEAFCVNGTWMTKTWAKAFGVNL